MFLLPILCRYRTNIGLLPGSDVKGVTLSTGTHTGLRASPTKRDTHYLPFTTVESMTS